MVVVLLRTTCCVNFVAGARGAAVFVVAVLIGKGRRGLVGIFIVLVIILVLGWFKLAAQSMHRATGSKTPSAEIEGGFLDGGSIRCRCCFRRRRRITWCTNDRSRHGANIRNEFGGVLLRRTGHAAPKGLRVGLGKIVQQIVVEAVAASTTGTFVWVLLLLLLSLLLPIRSTTTDHAIGKDTTTRHEPQFP